MTHSALVRRPSRASGDHTTPAGTRIPSADLHARRIVIPHPDRGVIDVTAPLPPHMRQSWNLIGLDEASAGETG